MNITFTDFSFGDLVVLISTINIIINFCSILFYEEFKALRSVSKNEKK